MLLYDILLETEIWDVKYEIRDVRFGMWDNLTIMSLLAKTIHTHSSMFLILALCHHT